MTGDLGGGIRVNPKSSKVIEMVFSPQNDSESPSNSWYAKEKGGFGGKKTSAYSCDGAAMIRSRPCINNKATFFSVCNDVCFLIFFAVSEKMVVSAESDGHPSFSLFARLSHSTARTFNSFHQASEKPLSKQARCAIGYAEIFEHLNGKITLTEAVEKIKINTRRFAKAQRTWFKTFKNVNWLQIPEDEPPEKTLDRVQALIEPGLLKN